MGIPEVKLEEIEFNVGQVELMLNGVKVIAVEELEGKLQEFPPFNGKHSRQLLCYVDGKLCRVTTVTGNKDQFGN